MYNKHDKILGSLIGLHIGDCIGVTSQISQDADAQDEDQPRLNRIPLKWIMGGSSNATTLMVAVLNSVKKGKVDQPGLVNSLIEWNERIPTVPSGSLICLPGCGWHEHPGDMGNTIRRAIANMIDGKPLSECGITDDSARGDGSLIRCAPIAFFIPQWEHSEVAEAQCALTHNTAIAIECDKLLLTGLRRASTHGILSHDVLNAILEEASETTRELLIQRMEVEWENLPNSGDCIDSLGVAMWAMANAKSFEEGITYVVNRPGAETSAAVAGALLGAHYGYKSIPKKWKVPLQYRMRIIDICLDNI